VISTAISSYAGKIMLRVFRVWGATGVIIIIFVSGETMGPPADKLYPVEPVAVETIIPSAV